ncbi:glutathione S-transferase [Phenylobacterium sp. LH3H17]|uniref:glutathione S-transferase n=1 Tax=Phenylobacterium sp. LH3H17 TaxID=2903901 RepID=UPI0020CA056F|nr:glutathione S-transferase [Phenylobacterium sp. LH3H17]UTP41362.1 glutathione S-transferase [Phenylobacterium sp. LH3H17]
MSKIRLHGTPLSGHAHRVELMLHILGLDFEFREASAAVRATPEYGKLNPLRQIPVLEDGDLVLADSNAILVYLAKRYDPDGSWLLNDPVGAARMQRWLSIAAGEVMYGPATARMALQWNMPGDPVRAKAIAERLLAFTDQHLKGATYLAADHPTIADLACYSYVAHAPEGAIPLEPYSAVRAWLARVEGQPWFKPLPASPIPEPA